MYLTIMKKHRGKPIITITEPNIEDYATRLSISDSDELIRLIESSDKSLEYIDMLSGSLVGGLLQMIIRISGARKILEIGTFTGYSSIKMAEVLPEDGLVYTIEMNLKYQQIAEHHFSQSSHKSKIRLIKGNAQQHIDEIDEILDLVYLDGDKLRYSFYVEKCLPKLRSGGLIIADNVLWDGTVLKPQDHKAQAIADFNEFIFEHDQLEVVLLPIRDGVSLIRKV